MRNGYDSVIYSKPIKDILNPLRFYVKTNSVFRGIIFPNTQSEIHDYSYHV